MVPRHPASTTPSTSSATRTRTRSRSSTSPRAARSPSITWGELSERVAAFAAGLRSLGVESGDRVAAYLPNGPEALVGFLASASIGAIWSSCSPDFGARSVIDRFAQIEPKVLLAVDGYTYGGKRFRPHGRRPRASRPRCPPSPTPSSSPTSTRTPTPPRSTHGIAWADVAEKGAGAALEFERVPFDHPLWVLYSSGTTGLPKAIVQGHGGILLEHLKKMHLHVDAQDGDNVFWFTTTGWMMWNFLVSILLTPASIVLFDGNPGHPDLGTLWDLAEEAERHHLRHVGQLHRLLHEGGDRALARAATSRRSEPSARPAPRSRPRASSGSTSTSGATPGSSRPRAEPTSAPRSSAASPSSPSIAASSRRAPSAAPSRRGTRTATPLTGEVGELVITKPMPSMPVFFWSDPDGERYRSSYFEMYPGIWRHGDWIEITERGTAIIYGRSDSTINRGGIRMGTSEIYRAVLSLDEITDALVVDVPRPGTEGWMPLFVVLREGETLDDELIRRIAARVREDCSPRHVPNEVHEVAEVPRTLSGKVLEVPVKRILMGTPPEQAASRDSLANPAALDPFVELLAGERRPER